MTNEYCPKHKEKIRKEAPERYQNISQERKNRRQKRPENDIKLLLKK